SRWLSPVDLTAAAWIEQVPSSERAAYERRLGGPVVVANRQGAIARAGPRASYLPATLVTGIPPMTVPGLDLASEPGVTASIDRARTLYQVTATSLARPRDELGGLFLVQSAPRLANGTIQSGYVALFVPESWLRAGATGAGRLELRGGGSSVDDPCRWACARCPRGRCRVLRGTALEGQGRGRPTVRHLSRSDRGRGFRRVLQACEPRLRVAPRLRAGGGTQAALARLCPPRRSRENGRRG